eukprot:EG_transcript_14443
MQPSGHAALLWIAVCPATPATRASFKPKDPPPGSHSQTSPFSPCPTGTSCASQHSAVAGDLWTLSDAHGPYGSGRSQSPLRSHLLAGHAETLCLLHCALLQSSPRTVARRSPTVFVFQGLGTGIAETGQRLQHAETASTAIPAAVPFAVPPGGPTWPRWVRAPTRGRPPPPSRLPSPIRCPLWGLLSSDAGRGTPHPRQPIPHRLRPRPPCPFEGLCRLECQWHFPSRPATALFAFPPALPLPFSLPLSNNCFLCCPARPLANFSRSLSFPSPCTIHCVEHWLKGLFVHLCDCVDTPPPYAAFLPRLLS